MLAESRSKGNKASVVALAALMLSFCLFPHKAQASDSNLKVHVLDVGYGDALYIRLPSEQHMMIDTGSEEKADDVIRFLEKAGVDSIHILLITHFHDNHSGGLRKISERFPIQKLLLPPEELFPDDLAALVQELEARGTERVTVRRGDTFKLEDETQINIRHPATLTGDPNADSVVVELTHGENRFLFCGDITESVQRELIQEGLLTKAPHWILLPHHGGVLDELFSESIAPAPYKVISTGAHPVWKSPDVKTVERFRAGLFRTDQHGSLAFQSNGTTIEKLPLS